MGEGIRRDALAICFLAVGIFLTVALVSFHQMDPSLSAWSSKGAVVHNWGGAVGALVSDLLLQLFGLGAVGVPSPCCAVGWSAFCGPSLWCGRSWAAGGLLAVC